MHIKLQNHFNSVNVNTFSIYYLLLNINRKEKNLLPLKSLLLLLNLQKLSLLSLPFSLSMNTLHCFLPLPNIMTHHISNYITFISTDIHSYRRQIGAACDWMDEYAGCVLMSQLLFQFVLVVFYVFM